jgi:hypothetical protein
METKPLPFTGTPPRLMNAIVTGFNVIANHIQLILIPVVLDLFLWLGPHLRIKVLFQPMFNDWIETVKLMEQNETRQIVLNNQSIFQAALDQFNLLSLIRTWPIGVPSLIAPLNYQVTPLGSAPVQEVSSMGNAFLIWLGIVLIGIVSGSLYFSSVAFFVADQRPQLSARRLFWNILQTISLTFGMVFGLFIISIPVLLVLTLFSLFSPPLAQLIFLVLCFFLMWTLLPLVFSPHGIFSYGQSAVTSLLTSLRLVRNYMPGTGLFLVVLILLSEGLDVVWRIAPADSWMTLIGIAGHAFITTGLLASSFIYYQGGMRWMQESLQQMSSAVTKA